MRECLREVITLMRAGINCIWIKTFEEEEAVKDLEELLEENFPETEKYIWTAGAGSRKLRDNFLEKNNKFNLQHRDLGAFFSALVYPKTGLADTPAGVNSGVRTSEDSEGIYILCDPSEAFGSIRNRRGIRDVYGFEHKASQYFIVVAPDGNIPEDLSKLFRMVDYSLPDRSEIETLINQMGIYIRSANQKMDERDRLKVPDTEDTGKIIDSCLGLTKREIATGLSESLYRFGKMDPGFISAGKIEAVRKAGVLDYRIPEITLDDIGGNREIKKWLLEVKDALSPEARKIGLPVPKGALMVGVPGAGKTILAEAFAGLMGYPLIELTMSRIMSKLVGESERKTDLALEIVKSCAPCVFLIDECEKIFSGTGAAGGQCDGGVSNRIFASLLKFMNDNESGVFVILTSNDASRLPPEFTRSGRLDAQWYFGLPDKDERAEILKVHFSKFDTEFDDESLEAVADITEGYTGAELKEVVKNTVLKAYHRAKARNEKPAGIIEEDILDAVESVIPLVRSSREKINAIEMYYAGRARNASGRKEESQGKKESQPLGRFLL